MKKNISTLFVLSLLTALNTQAQEMKQSVYFEADTKVETDLTFYKRQLLVEKGLIPDVMSTATVTILPIIGKKITGDAWGSLIGIGVGVLSTIATTYATDESVKQVSTNFKLKTKQWGEGKVQGYLEVEGKEKCSDAIISFYGSENRMGSYDIYIHDDETEEVKIGELLTFEKEQSLHLSEDLTFVSVGRRQTSCSMTLHQNTKISFERSKVGL